MFGGGVHALRCGLEFFGADKVVFATDTPLGPIKPAIDALNALDISAADRRKIFSGNAERSRSPLATDRLATPRGGEGYVLRQGVPR
jgi:hypothetical protein